jgi:hypothetical protein
MVLGMAIAMPGGGEKAEPEAEAAEKTGAETVGGMGAFIPAGKLVGPAPVEDCGDGEVTGSGLSVPVLMLKGG